jgi:hypothetical protein
LAFNTSKKFVEGLGSDPKNDAIQQQVLAETIKLWQGGTLGESDPAAWDTTQDVLLSMSLLKEKIDNAKLFTNQFVDEAK